MYLRFTLCLVVAFCAASFPAFAQSGPAAPDAPADTTAPAPDLSALTAELAALRAEVDSLRAAPAPTPVPESIRFSGTIFAGYGVNTTGTEGDEAYFNSFSVDRLYLTAKGAFTETLGFRATTDLVRTESAATVALKYAYLDWKPQPWLNVRGGVIQTAWIDYVNKLWGWRGVAKTPADYAKLFPSADVGLSAKAKLPGRFGEAALHVQNGSGHKKLETDRFKDVSGRLVLTPFKTLGGALAPLQVAGHGYLGEASGEARDRWGALVAYPAKAFTLAAGYEARRDGTPDGVTDGAGLSAFGELHLEPILGLRGVSLIGLVDRYDPDTAASNDARLRTVVGATYRPLPALALALDYQRIDADVPSFDRFDGATTSADASVFLHVIVNY